ncbi:MAG: alpha-amylase family glycosyl hydrolase, partial [Bacteroidota bacterium]
MKHILLLFFTGYALTVSAQKIDRIEPPMWWTGMVNPELQLMLYGKDLGGLTPKLKGDGVRLASARRLENDNYLILDLIISADAKPQTITIDLLHRGKVKASFNYEIKMRNPDYITRQSFGASDVLYLITPDRFVNGDPTNDSVSGMIEEPNRTFKGGRHGGDIDGIINSLDYIKDMGFTAVWLNPVLENDMPEYSYHGYATTDFYKVDKRYGSNEKYAEMIEKAHSKGIKVIMDMIVNHSGSEHWWMK